jgi:hypothetical protein
VRHVLLPGYQIRGYLIWHLAAQAKGDGRVVYGATDVVSPREVSSFSFSSLSLSLSLSLALSLTRGGVHMAAPQFLTQLQELGKRSRQ